MSHATPVGFSESIIIPKSLLEKYCGSLLSANTPLGTAEKTTVFLENPPAETGMPEDDRMKILNEGTLDSDTKLKLYNQHKRLHYQKQKKALLVETREETAPVLAAGIADKIDRQRDAASITQLFPEKIQPFVSNILHKILERESLISWNERQEVIISGTKITGSSIVDLMRYVMGSTIITNDTDLPPGAALFVQALAELKIPASWLKLRRKSSRSPTWINY